MVTRTEIPHDCPLPHMDFLEHTINYRVPSDGEILATVMAVDMNEVLAAAEAAKENLSPEVMAPGPFTPRMARISATPCNLARSSIHNLTKKAGAPELQDHLTATRAAGAAHLE